MQGIEMSSINHKENVGNFKYFFRNHVFSDGVYFSGYN